MRFDLVKAIPGHLTGETFGAKNTGGGEHASRSEIARLAYELYEQCERARATTSRGPIPARAASGV